MAAVEAEQIDRVLGVELIDFSPVRPVERHPLALLDVNVVTQPEIGIEIILIEMAIVSLNHMNFGHLSYRLIEIQSCGNRA